VAIIETEREAEIRKRFISGGNVRGSFQTCSHCTGGGGLQLSNERVASSMGGMASKTNCGGCFS